MRKLVVVTASLLVLGAAAAAVVHTGARAQAATSTAFICGLRSDKTGSPVLSVFNTSPSAMSLHLLLRGPDGAVLVDRATPLDVGKATRSRPEPPAHAMALQRAGMTAGPTSPNGSSAR